MDIKSEIFLVILKSSLHDRNFDLSVEISTDEWQELLKTASIHSVLPMFYEAVYASPSL